MTIQFIIFYAFCECTSLLYLIIPPKVKSIKKSLLFDLKMMKRSQSFTLSFLRMKSVSFSLSNSVLNSYYQTFDEMRETFTMTTTQSNYF